MQKANSTIPGQQKVWPNADKRGTVEAVFNCRHAHGIATPALSDTTWPEPIDFELVVLHLPT